MVSHKQEAEVAFSFCLMDFLRLVRWIFRKILRFIHTAFHSLWKTAALSVKFWGKMSSVLPLTYDKTCDICTFLPFQGDKSVS